MNGQIRKAYEHDIKTALGDADATAEAHRAYNTWSQNNTYTITDQDVYDMVAILEQLPYDSDGKIVHQNTLGPEFLQSVRDLLSRLQPS